MSTWETIKALPKVEQHIHIIGSTRPETLLWLMERKGNPQYPDLQSLEEFYRYTSFEHFLEVYSTVNDLVDEESIYERLTYEMLEDCSRSNTRHVECIFSAYDHVRRGLDYGEMLDAINRGIRRARERFGVSCNIRVDLVRNYGPETGMRVLDLIEEKGDNIVAIDTGGSEAGHPPRLYRDHYERAREMGLHTVAHQGEGAGADYVWECLRELRPERIGHGVAAGSDPQLLRELAKRGVAVECCPLSNVATGVVPRLEDHPIRRFIESGVQLSVNTDDPPMFGSDMNKEYWLLHRRLGFSLRQLFQISLDSVETSFIPDKEKKRMRKEFLGEWEKICDSWGG